MGGSTTARDKHTAQHRCALGIAGEEVCKQRTEVEQESRGAQSGGHQRDRGGDGLSRVRGTEREQRTERDTGVLYTG